MTPEGRVAAYLKAQIRARGGLVRKVSWEGRIGAPDLLVMLDGRHYFVETKAPGQRPRPAQVVEFEEMEAAGGIHVVVLDSKKAIDEWVNGLYARSKNVRV